MLKTFTAAAALLALPLAANAQCNYNKTADAESATFATAIPATQVLSASATQSDAKIILASQQNSGTTYGSGTETAGAGSGTKDAMMAKDIVDTAVGAGEFTTLVAAVQAAGLVDVLKGDGPFTVFAPTDAAFAALPAGTVESLLRPENRDQLTSILTYHVVPGKVMASDLSTGLSANTVEGQAVTFDLSNGAMVNGANIVTPDIATSNGVIHVIDTVLLPANAS